MAKQIKNVALAGATGNVGSNVLRALLALNKFNITVLTRREGSFPSGVAVQVVDFSSVPALTSALEGQDAVIDTTQSPDSETPIRLIDAAAAAGVYRFIPSDFGLDPTNPKVQALPVFARKDAGARHVQQKAKETGMTWTIVSNGPFLDWNLATAFMNIDLQNKKVRLFDDGGNTTAWTTLESIGKATAAVLLHPEETENRPVYIHSIFKSQKQVADIAKEALGADGWEETRLNAQEMFEKAMADFKAGVYSWQVFGDMIRYAQSQPDYSQPWKKDDNVLLGVKEMSDEELRDLIRQLAVKKD